MASYVAVMRPRRWVARTNPGLTAQAAGDAAEARLKTILTTGYDLLSLVDGELARIPKGADGRFFGMASGAAGWTLVPWTSLSGVPSTFPPGAHNHTTEEITGLAAFVNTTARSALGTIGVGYLKSDGTDPSVVVTIPASDVTGLPSPYTDPQAVDAIEAQAGGARRVPYVGAGGVLTGLLPGPWAVLRGDKDGVLSAALPAHFRRFLPGLHNYVMVRSGSGSPTTTVQELGAAVVSIGTSSVVGGGVKCPVTNYSYGTNAGGATAGAGWRQERLAADGASTWAPAFATWTHYGVVSVGTSEALYGGIGGSTNASFRDWSVPTMTGALSAGAIHTGYAVSRRGDEAGWRLRVSTGTGGSTQGTDWDVVDVVDSGGSPVAYSATVHYLISVWSDWTGTYGVVLSSASSTGPYALAGTAYSTVTLSAGYGTGEMRGFVGVSWPGTTPTATPNCSIAAFGLGSGGSQ